MNTPLRVVFFGNHTVGVRALRVLEQQSQLVGVVAHPADPEDGVRYESVYAEATRLRVRAIRARGNSAEAASFVAEVAPDLIWITDYRYLLPGALVAQSRLGAINLHPSLLPEYRGRAPINWAILRGETRLGLTAHVVDEGMDTGDIIAQRAFELEPTDDVGDALDKLYPLYQDITAEVITQFHSGAVPRRPQDHSKATVFARRTPEDGRIDWNAPAQSVWNLVRAVAAPYPGAFTDVPNGRVMIWKAAQSVDFASGARPLPGEIVAMSANRETVTIACADRALEVTKYELSKDAGQVLRVGDRLGDTAAQLTLLSP